jgi:hypothetical protein
VCLEVSSIKPWMATEQVRGGFDKKSPVTTPAGEKSHPHTSGFRSPMGLNKVKVNSITRPRWIGAPKEERGW